MTIKQHGGVFGRNPTFNEIGGTLTTAAQPNITSLGTQTENLAFADGNGIDFSATAGTGTSELFDDYEEGTWTPTLIASGVAFDSVTYDSLTGGRYTKIGNLVHIQMVLRTDAVTVGSATGNLFIGGLPFTCAADNGSTQDARASMTIAQANSFASNNPIAGTVEESSTDIKLWYRSAVDGDAQTVAIASVGTGANANLLRLSGSYITA